MSSESSQHPTTPDGFSLRSGAVLGGVIAGFVGLVFVASFLIYINRKVHRATVAQAKAVRADDPEDIALSVTTYLDEKESDALYSPTEKSPSLGHLAERNGDPSRSEKNGVEQNSARPPPFPVYQQIAL
ncbi:hypothetical protein DRE_01302 [Drechslerella stenobrocha 248]|uniref:Uncharacterized protein n=1 Tax=Drechslerella stenobrocha 248 TaxID=1043628 RepID=W7I5B5_9PEZI|nr:hypothetical protein DRE_01302 [Drechslerella stenobrocha 248]